MKYLFIIFLILSPVICSALTQKDIECVMQEWEKFRIQGRRYISGDWDCSKAFQQACANCGIAIKRCRAKDYAKGNCGFTSKKIPINDTKRGDVLFWSWGKESKQPYKQFSHVGEADDSDTAYHNSFGRKRVVKDDLIGILVGDLEDFARRFVLKDDKPVAPKDIKVETKGPKQKSIWEKWFK